MPEHSTTSQTVHQMHQHSTPLQANLDTIRELRLARVLHPHLSTHQGQLQTSNLIEWNPVSVRESVYSPPSQQAAAQVVALVWMPVSLLVLQLVEWVEWLGLGPMQVLQLGQVVPAASPMQAPLPAVLKERHQAV